jgi:hypothetical protein
MPRFPGESADVSVEQSVFSFKFETKAKQEATMRLALSKAEDGGDFSPETPVHIDVTL